jgi:hypothetical protein
LRPADLSGRTVVAVGTAFIADIDASTSASDFAAVAALSSSKVKGTSTEEI